MTATLPGHFGQATTEWFAGAFSRATDAQLGAWNAIAHENNVLVVAPTGSGKTLAAFLSAVDRLAHPATEPRPGTKVLYISPLKALGVDVERNLRTPLIGIEHAARRLGQEPAAITVGVRSGDTPATERRRLVTHPPDILITTPESLYLMLTSEARRTLAQVHTVIVDEIHAIAATKRGSHLAVSLERLDNLLPAPAQRIGLSATVRPVDAVARYLGGSRPVKVVAPEAHKSFELKVIVPVDDMNQPAATPLAYTAAAGGAIGAAGGVGTASSTGADGELPEDPLLKSIWPHIEERVVDAIEAHTSTIVFVNSRRLAERITARLNEIEARRAAARAPALTPVLTPVLTPALSPGQSGSAAGAPPVLARAHHGSVSKEQRALIEDDLKMGRLRCVVATSSLELGIDMGDVDLVVQVESPPSVASGLQRVGRAGHQVGETSRALLFPKHQHDLLQTAVVTDRMLGGEIEAIASPANPLDVLAQQTVAAASVEPVEVDRWFETVRRSAPFAGLARSVFDTVIDLVSGRYPSEEFAELRPRVVYDREAGVLTARPGAQRLAVTNGGTIPDRGLFGVFLVGEAGTPGRRVGELDEEMVYESRVGDVFALGTTSWRIQEITHDRVIVTPAFGEPARLPFWKGDSLGRPAELGEAIGTTIRLATRSKDVTFPSGWDALLDDRARSNLSAYLHDQREATSVVPNDREFVVERFLDELGDHRIVLHSPYGAAVHAPWALAIAARVRERYGIDAAAHANDDGIVVRIPDSDSETPGAELFEFDADEIESIVTDAVGGSSIFASRFREAAARALLLPRRNPGTRSPLWLQRQKSAQLLDVARKYPTFPIVLEAIREVLTEAYDLAALKRLLTRTASGEIRVRVVDTPSPSPFARSLMYGYVEQFLYEGDSPLAERRAAALTLDSELLADLLGRAELRDLLDPEAIDELATILQWRSEDRRVRDAEGLADLLRVLGPLSVDELAERSTLDTEHLSRALTSLERERRVVRVTIASAPRFAAVEDAATLRDALGAALPLGIPAAFLDPKPHPLDELVARWARSHTPFTAHEPASRFGLGTAVVTDALRRLAQAGRVAEGAFLPHGQGTEWCDSTVLRRLRRLSLAKLRRDVEPVEGAVYAEFLPDWHGIGGAYDGIDGVLAVIDQLGGVPLPASAWETFILPLRVHDYEPSMLDELTTAGEVILTGSGALPGNDGLIALHLADSAPVTIAAPDAVIDASVLERGVLDALATGGAFFARQLRELTETADDAALADAVWTLFWRGLITNDSFSPVRGLLSGGAVRRATSNAHRAAPRPVRGRIARPGRAASAGGPSHLAGRWSLAPSAAVSDTVRARARAEGLLDRYGIVTRGAVAAEAIPGGFAGVYRTLTVFEDSGRARRGYFIEHLGAAQFSVASTIDRLRSYAHERDIATDTVSPLVSRTAGPEPSSSGGSRTRPTVTLAATDPANPFGAALPWPDIPESAETAHRAGRKAGALVVIDAGEAVLYVERGGKTSIVWNSDPEVLARAARSLAETLRTARITKFTLVTANGEYVVGSGLGDAFRDAGFVPGPQGLQAPR